MTAVHLFMAWLDSALLCSMVVLWIGSRYKWQFTRMAIGVAIVSLAMLIPVHGLSLFIYVWSIIGDLSLTSKVFMIAWLLYRTGGPVLTDMKEIRFVLRAVSVIGLAFYPMALGLTPFDPYSAGYSASILVIWTIVAATYGLRKGYSMLAAAMLASLWVYLLGGMESDNLFDYLLDPVLFLYALSFSCATLLQNRKRTKTADQA